MCLAGRRAFAASLAVGLHVFVCDNLSFSGDIKATRKHTVHIRRDLPKIVGDAVRGVGDHERHQQRRIARYKHYDLSSRAQQHDILVQSVEEGVIPGSKLMDVLQEWRAPSHPEFKGRNAWNMFNCFTEQLKGYHAEQLRRRTNRLHDLMDRHTGLVNQAV